MKKITFVTISLLYSLTAQYTIGGDIEGEIVWRYSHPDYVLKHPIPAPNGDRICLTSPGYKGIFLLTTDNDVNMQIVTEEEFSGFHRLFDGNNEILYFVTRKDKLYYLHQYLYRESIALAEPISIPQIRRLHLSKQGTLIMQDIHNNLLDGQRNLTSADSICYYDNNRITFQVGDHQNIHYSSDDRLIINAVVSPDVRQVVFQESGQRLYIWDLKTGFVEYIGQGERPIWDSKSLNLVAMLPKDDGYKVTSSTINVYSIQKKTVYTISIPETGIWMNPYFMPGGHSIVVENRQKNEIVIIKLPE